MNIQLNYLYRDAGNYKKFYQVVFENKQCCTVESVDQKIRSLLIDGSYFIASNLNLPDLRMEFLEADSDLDHEWHEFESVAVVADAATMNLDIADFIEKLEKVD